MRLHSAPPPFVRTEATAGSMLGATAAALCALLVPPIVRYGARPLAMAGASVLTCLLCETLVSLARSRRPALAGASFAVTGLSVALLLPLNAPLWLPCAAAAFAVLAAGEPFGGFGRAPFTPAAAGIAFAALCWPELVFTYFDPAQPYALPPLADCAFHAARSPAALLRDGLKPDILPLDLLWGTAPGPLGGTAALVLGACALALFLCRAARPETTLCFLLAAAALAALFPRIACSPLTSVKYELLSGSLLFCAVFLAPDPAVSPYTAAGRCLYGAFAGAAAMAFRRYGAFEQGAPFALLLADAVSPLISSAVCRLKGWEGKPYEAS